MHSISPGRHIFSSPERSRENRFSSHSGDGVGVTAIVTVTVKFNVLKFSGWVLLKTHFFIFFIYINHRTEWVILKQMIEFCLEWKIKVRNSFKKIKGVRYCINEKEMSSSCQNTMCSKEAILMPGWTLYANPQIKWPNIVDQIWLI